MVEALSSGVHTLACAVVRGEFDDAEVDAEVLERIRDGEIDLWVEQIEATGLFTELELEYLRLQWSRAPELLIAALLGDLDEVAAERAAVRSWGRASTGSVVGAEPAGEWADVVNG